MKNINNRIIIGIDHGYGNIKTASCCFKTGVTAYDKEPTFKDNLLVWQDKYYLIGEEHKEFFADKMKDMDYYALTLTAIARELNTQKFTTANVHIAAGLPLTWVSEQKEEFKKYLLQNDTADFTFRGVAYHINFVGADIFPQGFAAVADKLVDFKGTNMLCDIGNGTMNVMYINDRKPNARKCFTEKYGVNQCLFAVKENMMRIHHATVEDSIITRVLRFGTANIAEDYLKTITDTATEYVSGIFRRLREHEYDPKLIDVNKFDASLQIINAIISIDNYIVGINVPSGDVTVQGSRITVANADCGISGGNEIDNFIIQGSVLDFTGEGVSSIGLLNGRDIQIDSSLVKIISQNSNAIYTDGAISIRNGSSLEMKSFYPALFSTLDTTITDSAVIAISTDDSGIYSRANIFINGTSDILARGHWAGINANGNITINNGKIYSTSSNDMGIYLRGIFTMNGGDVYAQGATGFAAIGARYTKQEGDTEPIEKIVVNSNYADIGGGKVSVSDWYNGASGETTWSRSWSSFIAGNDNKLASDRSNALNEITIKIKLADYSAVDKAIAAIPADLSIYTDATANIVTAAKDAIIRGKNITEQSVVDGYATAIENAVNALVYKGADYSKVDEAIAAIPADLSNYTDETAKAVNDAKNAVVRGKNITEQPTADGYATAIENAVNALVYKGADYSKVDEAIATIPADLSNYTEATTNAVTSAKNAVVRGKNITEQTIVDSYVTAIESAVAALILKPVDSIVPEIISGANQEIEQGKSATFTSNSDFANFLRVLIDGMEISSDKYTVKEGSTIVTLNTEFIKTLDKGKHTLSIVSTDGRADAGFTVIKAVKPTNPNTDIPQTGDNFHMVLWMSLLFISTGGVLTLLLKRKRASV